MGRATHLLASVESHRAISASRGPYFGRFPAYPIVVSGACCRGDAAASVLPREERGIYNATMDTATGGVLAGVEQPTDLAQCPNDPSDYGRIDCYTFVGRTRHAHGWHFDDVKASLPFSWISATAYVS
jgi:hypothetical protein